ncbi:hypothetical protein VTK56DRAFT_7145 [Thermocarpiscus australiensis]
MARPPRTRISDIVTLVSLFSTLQLASALQVTPNSPCASLCRDSTSLDVSDPNSSSTRNSDITCEDSKYSSAAGTKFKNCMTCLQNSTFSQGSESDTMWFLYNLRYAAAYCVFGFPNATGIESTPCRTSTACGPLQASLEHGILSPRNTTAYSYCSAGHSEAMASNIYDKCIPCISAEGKTDYLANYFVALHAGCQQQPAPGVLLGLNDTIFSDYQISIIDPTGLKDGNSSSPGLATPAIVGIAAGAVVLILIVAAATFICLRKRRNRRARSGGEVDFYGRFGRRPPSSISFQCQTHMTSPRLWPGAEQGALTLGDETISTQASRSSIWKPHDFFETGDGREFAYQQDDSAPHISKRAAIAAVQLHHITTSIPPVPPPQARTSPSAGDGVHYSPSDFKSPLSADSVRSTTALLPTVKPYVPAEHGVHGDPAPAPAGAFSSPLLGTAASPLLNGHGWPDQLRQQQQQQKRRKSSTSLSNSYSPPTPLSKPSRSSGVLGKKGVKSARTGVPVESWEIRTAFPAPPKR